MSLVGKGLHIHWQMAELKLHSNLDIITSLGLQAVAVEHVLPYLLSREAKPVRSNHRPGCDYLKL